MAAMPAPMIRGAIRVATTRTRSVRPAALDALGAAATRVLGGGDSFLHCAFPRVLDAGWQVGAEVSEWRHVERAGRVNGLHRAALRAAQGAAPDRGGMLNINRHLLVLPPIVRDQTPGGGQAPNGEWPHGQRRPATASGPTRS